MLSQSKLRVVLLSPEGRIVARPPNLVNVTDPVEGKYSRVKMLTGLARVRLVKDGS